MNVILINLGGDLQNIKTIMDEIKRSELVLELPNNSWVICSEQNVYWWNNFLFDRVKENNPSVSNRGNIKLAYYLCDAENICGLLDKTVIAKIKELREKVCPAKPLEPPIRNILDRMDVEQN